MRLPKGLCFHQQRRKAPMSQLNIDLRAQRALATLALAATVLASTTAVAQSCDQLFARYNGSSWWWGALGNCKTGPGGTTDRTAIFDCAWAQVPANEQTSCLRDRLLVTDQTRQGIDVVAAYNMLTCDQLFARYNGSSWWWGALGNCKTGPGGITDRTAIFDCAWAQVPATEQTSCLRDRLLVTDQTRQGIDVVIAYNAPPTCDQLFARYKPLLKSEWVRLWPQSVLI